jgi:hypothetical protein
MNFSLADALQWTAWITGAGVTFQTLELLSIRSAARDSGVWHWNLIRKDFAPLPWPARKALDALLGYRGLISILILRLVSAIAMAMTLSPIATGVVFITTLLISLRWRGSFNGGSDFMNLIVLSALCVAESFHDHTAFEVASLWYIAIQTCTSYFIAGVIKLKRANWRNGRALSGFLQTTIYKPDPFSNALAGRSELTLLASWSVMIFECSFPLALFNPQFCLLMIGLGVLFHLGNFYFFGLNRFLLSWAAAYPALYFCSQLHSITSRFP